MPWDRNATVIRRVGKAEGRVDAAASTRRCRAAPTTGGSVSPDGTSATRSSAAALGSCHVRTLRSAARAPGWSPPWPSAAGSGARRCPRAVPRRRTAARRRWPTRCRPTGECLRSVLLAATTARARSERPRLVCAPSPVRLDSARPALAWPVAARSDAGTGAGRRLVTSPGGRAGLGTAAHRLPSGPPPRPAARRGGRRRRRPGRGRRAEQQAAAQAAAQRLAEADAEQAAEAAAAAEEAEAERLWPPRGGRPGRGRRAADDSGGTASETRRAAPPTGASGAPPRRAAGRRPRAAGRAGWGSPASAGPGRRAERGPQPGRAPGCGGGRPRVRLAPTTGARPTAVPAIGGPAAGRLPGLGQRVGGGRVPGPPQRRAGRGRPAPVAPRRRSAGLRRPRRRTSPPPAPSTTRNWSRCSAPGAPSGRTSASVPTWAASTRRS